MSLIGNISSASSVSLDGYSAGGDLSGTYPNPKVVGIDGYGITPLADGYLYYNGTAMQWLAVPAVTSVTLGGDVTGNSASNTVSKLDGYTLPSPTPGVLEEVSGSLQWGPVNLASSSYVSGILPTANQAAQPITGITGDAAFTGSTSSGIMTLDTVNSNVGSFGSSTQVAQVTVNGKGLTTAVSNVTISGVTPGGSAGGDLSGTFPNPKVVAIDGYAVPVPSGSNTLLTYNTGALTWAAPTTYVSLAGDLGNTNATPEVISITGPSGGVLPVGTSANPLTETTCTITDAYTVNTLFNALQTSSNSATTIHTIAVASNTTIFVNASVLGVDGLNDGYVCSATLSFTAIRQTNLSSGTLTLVPTAPMPAYITNLSGSSMSVSASVSSNNIIIQVVGLSSKTCRWQSACQVQEVG
jgi:hypothetical protein